MSLETAIRKALERVGPGADPEQRARVYQSARLALENGMRQQNITDPATASEQRRQLEAAINRVERDAKLDYMEHEARNRAARETAEREERRKRELEMAEQARAEAEQARERAERAREQAERDAELRRRRDEIDRERVARELEYEAAQRALRERIAAREQAARERALQEREQMLAAERQEEDSRRQAEDARRNAAEQSEREAEARRRALEEQAEREEAIRVQAERERLAREQAAREFAERQAAEREREAQAREQSAREEAARQAAERERFVREEAERRVAEEEARRAADAERTRLAAARAEHEARERESRLAAASAASAIGGMVRHENAPARDRAPSLDDAPSVELERDNGPREPVFDIMPEVERRDERRAPSFDIETPEPVYADDREVEPQPEVIHLPPERAIKPRRKSRWKARAFALVTLAAFGAAGWWWVESTGLTLPKAVRDGSVPNPPPSVKEADFDGAKQLKSLSRQGGYGDEWTKLFEAGKSKSFSVGSQATAKVEQSGSGPYLAITSATPGLDGSVSIELPQSTIAAMQGKTSNVALMLEGGDKPVQVTVECEFGGLGNCGRHRFLLSQNKTDLMFDVEVKSGGAAEGPGRLLINADAGGEGNSVKLFSIHVLPGS
ncbi:hypothetical protein [Rhizobium sp. C4]|uniref:hypothetical protein n=1 Tax=Rhizobium sp. C4 TaxID=1349800 RepID=UPI001E61CD51|nr:hypothetical protein [Rhizobium sp. C4]MCD2174562.1 hypothetical protein [Rhizobium sp. C4]